MLILKFFLNLLSRLAVETMIIDFKNLNLSNLLPENDFENKDSIELKKALSLLRSYNSYIVSSNSFEYAKKYLKELESKSFEVKEIRITPNIDTHDFEFKAKNARKFLEDGNKVKITLKFRGREMNYIKLGEEVLQKFIDDLSDISVPEKKPLLEGKNMFIILAKKADK